MHDVFSYMNYIGKTSNMQFMMNKPGTKNNTVAVCYGGRSAIREWGGDELYEQLVLSQYDKIKDKPITADFSKMAVEVDFEFVSKSRNGAEYFEIVGIVGNPTISF